MRTLVATLFTLALIAPGAAHAAPAPALQTSSLEVRLHAAPFAIEFVDRADGDVLRTIAPGAGNDPYGPLTYAFDLRQPVVNNAYLGYYVAAEAPIARFHATRLLSVRQAGAQAGSALVLDVATDDPLGHRLEVTLGPRPGGAVNMSSRIAPGSGPLARSATVSSAAFQAVGGERYLGFGERSNAVDQTGNRVFNWAEEGPFSSGNGEKTLRPLVPDFTFPTGPTATNFPVPWLLSTRGLGLLVDQTQRSTFHLLDERRDAWRAEAQAGHLSLTVFGGPTPARAVRRYSDYAGRQPTPRGWFFGPWVQFKDPWPERFRQQDVPTTVAQTYTHYLPCGAQRGREAAERRMVARHHDLGYRITTYFNPHVCTKYSEVYDPAAKAGLFVRNGFGRPYLLTNPFTADQVVSEIDFTNPGGRRLFGRLLDDAVRTGYDGWMEDFGEYTPTDSVFSDGRRGLEMHNRYPVIYHAASTEHTGPRFAAFIRSGFHGVQRHARVVWGGDPTEDWSCSDGLCAAVHQSLSMGLSGIAYWGSDIGGFHAIANPRTDDELNTRWLEFGAVSGVMRTQANGLSIGNRDRAKRSQVWSPKVLPTWRRYAKLRTQLYPYLAAASSEYQRGGLPIARHLALAYPDDPRATRSQLEFMFGPDLLAAPVVRPGERTRGLYLPRGRWIDLWRSAAYGRRAGDLSLGRPRTLDGGRQVSLPAPLDELPLLVRAGAILPLLSPDVDTLADSGQGRGLVHLRERRYRLTLLAFPRGSARHQLGTGVRGRSAEGRRSWRLALRARRTHRFELQATLSTLRRPFRPCSLRLGRRALPRRSWRYTSRTGVLRASFRARRATLVVRGCRGR